MEEGPPMSRQVECDVVVYDEKTNHYETRLVLWELDDNEEFMGVMLVSATPKDLPTHSKQK